jgi:hypothetical protein
MRSVLPKGWRPPAIATIALALAACGTTYGTGVNPGAQTLKDITGMVTLGTAKDSGPPIAYENRPPIVAPPTTEVLPEPGSGTTVANWPRDPDVAAREQQLANANRPSEQANALVDPGFRLPKQKVVPYEEPSLDEQLFSLSGAKKREAQTLIATAKGGAAGRVDENGNPIRTSLTEPPPEYRIPDPSAPQEFQKASKRKWLFWKKDPPVPTATTTAPADTATTEAGGTTPAN